MGFRQLQDYVVPRAPSWGLRELGMQGLGLRGDQGVSGGALGCDTSWGTDTPLKKVPAYFKGQLAQLVG